ncbi:MAG: HU domain-containing protein [Flavobacteriales bacterium]
MQLSNYINDLLYRYECVIVPGFGAFLTHFHSAIIDEKQHLFYPPSKTVSFNKQLQTNDGLLANYIATIEQCSYEIALQKIRKYTNRLSLDLSEGKTISLENIGNLSLSSENKVQFYPSNSQNFNTASFGLSQFVSQPTKREIYLKTVKTLDQKAPLLLSSEKKETIPYLKYAAIAIIAISLSGFGGLKWYENQVQKNNYVEKQQANTLVEHQIQQATFEIENPLPALKLTLTKQKGKYHIIAGAFRIEENAHKKIKQLAQKGYTATLLGKNKYGLHQVAYQSFENRKEATVFLRKIIQLENKDAWLLIKEVN